MKRIQDILRVAAVVAMVGPLACGGDKSPSPADPGPTDGSVVLLSGARPADWVCPPDYCRMCRIQDDVMASHDTTYLLREGGTPTGAYYCSPSGGSCAWASANRIDFRPYSSARVQLRVTLAKLYGNGQGTGGRLVVRVKSNVPGTPDLTIIDEAIFRTGPINQEWSRTFDVSLENALTFAEGTVEVSLVYHHQTPPTQFENPPRCLGASEARLNGLRVIARR